MLTAPQAENGVISIARGDSRRRQETLSLPLKFNFIPRGLPRVFRFVRHLAPWSMMEVFMLGILVSVVKLAKMAKIVPGVALFSFLALIFVMAAMTASLDSHLIWEKWENRR